MTGEILARRDVAGDGQAEVPGGDDVDEQRAKDEIRDREPDERYQPGPDVRSGIPPQGSDAPAGIPKTSDISVASSVNSMVMPDRRTISAETDVRIRNDSPRSPRSALPSQRAYWTMTG